MTLLFTDVEGSTALLHRLGAEGYAAALAEHRRVVREAFEGLGGVEVDTQGDAFFYVFTDAGSAVAAAAAANDGLLPSEIRIRMGLHTGTPHLTEEGYVGEDVHLGARIAAAGHGGQVLLSGATRALLDSAVVELGEHRLKDFAEPIVVFQLGEERFPPLKTVSNTNLPRPASTFIGRGRETTEVTELVREHRLVTLSGPGGTGKTRLAIEAAADLVGEFKAGVFWISLAALRDPTLVLETVGQSLGAKGGLAEHIGERELLLLLDNFEQVVDAAPELASLVESCPNLHVIATSRELLRVRGEVNYSVLPLAASESIALFSERAQLDANETVAELCRRLDNLPLAVELAASRTRLLTPAQILERLGQRLDLLKGGRDADARQQTLRGTIEWSHDLLAVGERRLFARLAVFPAGCTLAAAEAVCDADLDTLQSLVDKSLLRHTHGRFWMLETIREYALECVARGNEEDQVRRRHFEHYLDIAKQADAEHNSAAWLPMVARETENLREALDYAARGDPRLNVELAVAVAAGWLSQGRAGEALERLMTGLSRYETRDVLRARALMQLGNAERALVGARDAALGHLDEARALWKELGDANGEANALEQVGWLQDVTGNWDAAVRAQEQSIELRKQANSRELESAGSMACLCHVLIARGEIERAEARAKELLELGLAESDRVVEEIALHFLADCPLVAGDYAEAERRYLRALTCAHEAGLVYRAIDELTGVAMSLAGQGRLSAAVRLGTIATAKKEALGKGSDPWWQSMQERLLGGAREAMAPEELDSVRREAKELEFESIVDAVLESTRG